MAKEYKPDGLPVNDQSTRALIQSPWRKALAWYANKAFNGGLNDLNRRASLFLERDSDTVVLDVGTGDAELFLWWARFIGTTHLHAMDAIPNAHGVKVQTTIASLEAAWPFSDSMFDAVISSQSIEHIVDTPLYLREFRRVLKPGGYGIILTENLASWLNIGATVLGWMPFSFTNMFGVPFGNRFVWHEGLVPRRKEIEEFYERRVWGALGHQRLFTLFALGDLCRRYGLEIEASFGEGYIPFFGLLSRCGSRINPAHSHFIGVKVRRPD